MKKIKIFIIIIVILILSIFMLLFILNKQNDNGTIIEESNQIENNDTYEEIINNEDYYKVRNSIYTYLSKINKKSSAYYQRDLNGNEVLNINNPEIKENVYNLLSSEYIEKNNIEKNNVFNYVDDINTNVLIVPLKIEKKSKNQIDKYIVYGILEDTANNFIKEIYVYVNIDSENNSFSIEPIINKTNSNLNEIENKGNRIDLNSNNKVETVKITDEFLCQDYIDTYKRLALARSDLAYSYLDEEYRNKRFGNLDEFKKYVETNKNEIKGITLDKYLIQNNKYICRDKYENEYTFKRDSVIEFTYTLDSYTIETEKYKEQYSSSTEEEEVSLNTDKVVKMINNRDFKNIYNMLDESFISNYGLTEEKFEEYMYKKYNKYYTYDDTQITKQNGAYVSKVVLTDITKKEDFNEELTLIIQLKPVTQFKLSISVN